MNEYRARLKRLYAEIEQAFDQGANGDVLSRRMSDGVDALLRDIWRQKLGDAAAEVDLLAAGGYGRGELAPYSDWDLWVLIPEDGRGAFDRRIHDFLYALWDLGVKIGHAVRTVDETLAHVREDWNSATAALELRLLHGSGALFSRLRDGLTDFFRARREDFVRAKLAERDVRHARAGGTAFLMEPDIKEGQGGLRDVQSLFWMAKAWYGLDRVDGLVDAGVMTELERDQLLQAQAFLWRCRVGLHLTTRRASNRLGFERQVMLAERMRYQAKPHQPAVEALMKDYFRQAGRISRISGIFALHFRERLEPREDCRRDLGDGFTLEGDRIGLLHAHVFREEPLRMLRIFHLAQQGGWGLSSQALRQLRADVFLIDDAYRADAEACRLFMCILRSKRKVYWALKHMNDTGVLGRFIPEFRDVVGLGQFNRYHAYTVDEHTIRAVGEARNFWHRQREERLPLAHEVCYRINRPELLYLALLFHDIAKGKPGDHSENGARLARRFCERIGLNRDAAGLVEWLVREHLLMAVKSQRFDLADPKVIEAFAERVGDMERLNYLLLLTIADIAAVGPNVWNGWKGSLLQELYQSTAQCLQQGGRFTEEAERRYQLRRQVVAEAVEGDPELVRRAVDLLPRQCVMHFAPRKLCRMVEMLMRGRPTDVRVWFDEQHGETLALVIAPDVRGLFASLAAVITSGHANIVAAQAYTLPDGRVLDVFHLQGGDGAVIDEPSDLKRLEEKIRGVLQGRISVDPQAIPKYKGNVLMRRVPVRVRELPKASFHDTAIEVSAADRPGVLARLVDIISRAGYDLHGASISTFGERIVDVFFIATHDGKQLTAEQIADLSERLRAAACLEEAS